MPAQQAVCSASHTHLLHGTCIGPLPQGWLLLDNGLQLSADLFCTQKRQGKPQRMCNGNRDAADTLMSHTVTCCTLIVAVHPRKALCGAGYRLPRAALPPVTPGWVCAAGPHLLCLAAGWLSGSLLGARSRLLAWPPFVHLHSMAQHSTGLYTQAWNVSGRAAGAAAPLHPSTHVMTVKNMCRAGVLHLVSA